VNECGQVSFLEPLLFEHTGFAPGFGNVGMGWHPEVGIIAFGDSNAANVVKWHKQ